MAAVRSGTQTQAALGTQEILKRETANGPEVAALQQQLNALGATLKVDGKFGPATEAALKSWQGTQPGLKVDGKLGPQTRAALEKATSQVQVQQQRPPAPAQTQTPTWQPARPQPQSGQAQAPARVDVAQPAGQGTQSPATRALGQALNQGFQYIIGGEGGGPKDSDAFSVARQKLLDAGAKGAAIIQRPMEGTAAQHKAAVAQLKRAGITPIAYNNAFQTESDDEAEAWAGKARLGHDGDWDEVQPDFRKLPAWRDKRIGEAVAVAKAGFGGVMLDNVPVVTSKLVKEATLDAALAGDAKALATARAATQPAVDYIKDMARRARSESGNEAFGVLLQNGDALVRLHPELVTDGFVAGVQKESVLFGNKVWRDKTGNFHSESGRPTPENWGHLTAFQDLRRRFPDLPLTAVEYTKDSGQSAEARRRLAGSSGLFNRVLTAENDVMLNTSRSAAAGRRFEVR